MPLIPIQRIVSHERSVISAADSTAAAAQLLSGGAPNVVHTAKLAWQEHVLASLIDKYSDFLSGPMPELIAPPAGPKRNETKGFAAQTYPIQLEVPDPIFIRCCIYDPTRTYFRIDLCNIEKLNMLDAPVPLLIGGQSSTSLFCSLTADRRSGKATQLIRCYSIPIQFDAALIGLDVQFLFSFEQAGSSPSSDPHMSGFAFAAEVYQSVHGK
ncbi:histones H3 and H4 [Paenibacillus thiaminolyticus]|uniref:Histones H3 and H4 n=1 Tax=Paenibacillus thiaminolyticus TaxID=49283 RepID=A0A3A3GIN3_PANTH|nr:histones H3 and H4 [Paenibacillus thiaminolyticus]RJG23275.1 histones H3 and H4 [Paenibacillus thiaminolyticus]